MQSVEEKTKNKQKVNVNWTKKEEESFLMNLLSITVAAIVILLPLIKTSMEKNGSVSICILVEFFSKIIGDSFLSISLLLCKPQALFSACEQNMNIYQECT